MALQPTLLSSVPTNEELQAQRIAQAQAAQPVASPSNLLAQRAQAAQESGDFEKIRVGTPEIDEQLAEIPKLITPEGRAEVKEKYANRAQAKIEQMGKDLTAMSEELPAEGQAMLKETYGKISSTISSVMNPQQAEAASIMATHALASPPPKLNNAEQQEVTREIDETQQEIEAAAKDEGLWKKLLTGMGMTEANAKAAWGAVEDVASNPVDSAMAAGSAVVEGVSWLNDRIDLLTTLATTAAAASGRRPNIAVAIAQGLGAGFQAASSKKMAAAKAAEDKRRWETEQKISLMGKQTARSKEMRESVTLNANDIKQAGVFAQDLGVAQADVQSAMTMLKANGTPVTIKALKEALLASGVEDSFFGDASSGKLL